MICSFSSYIYYSLYSFYSIIRCFFICFLFNSVLINLSTFLFDGNSIVEFQIILFPVSFNLFSCWVEIHKYISVKSCCLYYICQIFIVLNLQITLTCCGIRTVAPYLAILLCTNAVTTDLWITNWWGQITYSDTSVLWLKKCISI